MKNDLFRKGLVYAIVVLFIGVSIMPSTGSNSLEKQTHVVTIDDTELSDLRIIINGTWGKNGWYVSCVTITITASGDIGIWYRLDGGYWRMYAGPFVVCEDGNHIIFALGVDQSGNQSTAQAEFKIDKTPPTTTHEFDGMMGENDWLVSDVMIILNAEDETSGVDYTMYKVDDGEWITYTGPFNVLCEDGMHILYYYSVDFAGNVEDVKGPFDFKIDQTDPTIELTAEKIGDNTWLFIADVFDETSGVNRVEFYVDGGFIGTVTEEPYEYEWSGTVERVAQAIVYDNAGNMAIREIVAFSQSQSQSSSSTPVPLVENVSNNRLSYSFVFIEPGLQTVTSDDVGYTLLQMPGCMAIGKQAGAPMLPVKSVKLLIPAMKTVRSVNVVGNSVELTGVEKPVFPYQNPVPIGFEQEEFQFNTALYASDLLYPSILHDGYHVEYSHGYAILDITLNPVQYIPGEGRLLYYPELTVNIDLEDTGEVNQFFRNNPDDRDWVEKLVYNPEITESYTSDVPTFDYPGGLCNPSDDYDYVIITTAYNSLDYWDTSGSIPYNWESLMDKHEQDDGLKCTLVTIQEITACTDYHNSDPLFNDLQAHIREFCKDAYEDWGTEYIFIGGDDEWIPARHMKYSYESNVDSDIYWSNLDKTFNDDHDDLWGEEEDLGFDLYSELFIGRITCDTPQDVSNWMTKSFYYADATDIDYLENTGFYGNQSILEYSALYGFETWNSIHPEMPYNLSVKWTAEPPNPGWQGGSTSNAIAGFKNAINNDHVTLISGIAHADATRSLDVDMVSWESDYHNTKPFFIHDQGSHCGDMDAQDDGVLHSMLFHSDTELAFACIYNTCYGWVSYDGTNSSSALQQKLFWDYLFDLENNSGSPINWQLGKAMAWSKDTMAPTINWTYSGAPGSWRAIIQGCLLFGDPAQKLKPPTNTPPSAPIIDGPTCRKPGVCYIYTFNSTDPEGGAIFYLIDWGDNSIIEWIGPYDSGVEVGFGHTWNKTGIFTIRAKAKGRGGESDWAYLEVTMPVNQQTEYSLLQRFLERFPNAFPILRYIPGL